MAFQCVCLSAPLHPTEARTNSIDGKRALSTQVLREHTETLHTAVSTTWLLHSAHQYSSC